jgi:hypothetical protein
LLDPCGCNLQIKNYLIKTLYKRKLKIIIIFNLFRDKFKRHYCHTKMRNWNPIFDSVFLLHVTLAIDFYISALPPFFGNPGLITGVGAYEKILNA